MPPDVAGALVLLGDMPRIEAQLIDALIDAFLRRARTRLPPPPHATGGAAIPFFSGRGLFEAAMRLTATRARAGSSARSAPSELVEVETPDTGVTFDIDTPADLAAAQRFGGGDR